MILDRYLSTDLYNLVLEYSWPDTDDIRDNCFYGNYEKILTLEKKKYNNWNWGLFGACRGGHKELVLLIYR